jgi:uncharacterized membrane protein YvbJ
MWECENCHHWNADRAKVCEQCGTSKLDSEMRRKEREDEEEIEQQESDMWDEDQDLM